MKRNLIKRGAWIFLVLLIAIQFLHPAKNQGEALTDGDIRKVVDVPDSVLHILQNSCYDCHSNYTSYPWYYHIQPIGFWMDDHVNEGKRELNFSEYASYKLKRKLHKLEEISKQLEKKEMPIPSYLIIHKNAELSDAQAELLDNWAKQSYVALKSRAAIDSTATGIRN